MADPDLELKEVVGVGSGIVLLALPANARASPRCATAQSRFLEIIFSIYYVIKL